MKLEDGQFFVGELLTALTNAGFNASVEQTGGGTATIFVNKVPNDVKILGGPGWYHWTEPNKSVFTTDEFFVGEDAYDNEDQQKDYDPDSVAAESGDSISALVELFVKEYERHN